MKILVTGGAGYIGSITVKRLQEKGYEVIVFDNLVYGHKESVSCKLVVGDLLDKEFLYKSLQGEKFDGVIHFAAYALAGESMEKPFKYFQNNILGGLNLLEFMKDQKIENIIFSSTCAMYGTPALLPVGEKAEENPESVYGESKLMFEKILAWYDRIYGIKHVNLRYFNAAGASLDGKLGEMHTPETHILPVAIKAALGNLPFSLFGSDYPPSDGTCIRDYIHISDLADAHIAALAYMRDGGKTRVFNCGDGHGSSVREVITAIEKSTGEPMEIQTGSRRPGDPPALIADSSRFMHETGWKPRYGLDEIVRDEIAWKKRNSNG